MTNKKQVISAAVTITGLLLAAVVPTLSCAKKQTDRYSFWKGAIENHYYLLDMNNQPLLMVAGKPYMVFEYDPLSGYPIRVEFGLSQARIEALPGCQGGIPEPFIGIDYLEYAGLMELKGPVALLCNWTEVTSTSKLPSGDFDFYIDKGSNSYGHEILHFTCTTGVMEGEIANESATWCGRISDLKAFNMLHLFKRGSTH